MLSGLRILDLTANLPGPFATMLLAELGAQVLKLERPPEGDPARSRFLEEGGRSPFFEAANRGKKSLTLNLKSPAGKEIFLRLLQRYDILVEGFRPGVMDRLGLGWEALRKDHPELIYVAISGFGQDSPWRQKSGHDINYMALAGALGMTGTVDGEPAMSGLLTADLGGGTAMALFGILAAVIDRQRTGRGRLVDISMMDGVLSWMAYCGLGILTGMEEGRPGKTWATGKYPCYRTYPTKDGRRVSFGPLEPHLWANFCRGIEREDLIEQAFGGQEVIDQLTDLFGSRDLAYWNDFSQEVDCCLEPVLTVEEALTSEHAQARGMVHRTEVNGQLRTRMDSPIRFSGYSPPRDPVSPQVGADNEPVLKELGYSPEEIRELRQAGAI